MKIKLLIILLSTCFFASCQSNNSAKKNLITGLKTVGQGISCEEVFLSDGIKKIQRTTFIYGEKFYINFDNVDGFVKEGGYAFPGMKLAVTNKAGDTVLYKKDMYSNSAKGYNLSPLLLNTNIITATPIHSDEDYDVNIHIWDKKGTGSFDAQLKINVVHNDKLSIKGDGVSYDEIYLFSSKEKAAVIDNKIKFGKTNYIIIEGLKGFEIENGEVAPGLKILIKDKKGTVILDEKDLAGDAKINSMDFTKQLAPNFIIPRSNIQNPLYCEILVWDKRSSNKITIVTSLTIVE